MTSDIDPKALALRMAGGLDSDASGIDPESYICWTPTMSLTVAEMRALAAFLREAVNPWRPIPVTPEIVRYVAQYGGRCRDCADTIVRPVCEGTGMPCGGADGAVRHVLSAINYGFSHGFLKFPPPARIEDAEEPSHDRR